MKKYLIAVYDELDICRGVYDNRVEFASAFNGQIKSWGHGYSYSTDHTLSRIYLKKRKSFIFNSERLYIHFIELSDDEIKQYKEFDL